MSPLFTARIGGVAQKAFVIMTRADGTAPGKSKINWPFGRLDLFRDRLEIRMLFNNFTLPLEAVERIERHLFFQVRIHHTSGHVPEYVSLFGWNLLGQLKRAAAKHRLPVAIQ